MAGTITPAEDGTTVAAAVTLGHHPQQPLDLDHRPADRARG
jgi:hypothetical protein